MRAIDTNLLVRLIARDDEHQTAAAEQFIRTGAWVSVLALAEMIWVLSSVYRLDHHALVKAVEGLLDNEKLTLEDSSAIVSALDLFRTHASVGFSDCLIVTLARKAGHLPLGTFDRRLAKVDGTQLIGAKSPKI